MNLTVNEISVFLYGLKYVLFIFDD